MFESPMIPQWTEMIQEILVRELLTLTYLDMFVLCPDHEASCVLCSAE